jgi:hypothetical protein
VKLDLVGETSNRAGFGARIKLTFNDAGVMRDVHRTMNAGGSFGGNPFRREIGIGAAERIDLLEIRWPSGIVQTFENVEPKKFYEVRESASSLKELPLAPIQFAAQSDHSHHERRH